MIRLKGLVAGSGLWIVVEDTARGLLRRKLQPCLWPDTAPLNEAQWDRTYGSETIATAC